MKSVVDLPRRSSTGPLLLLAASALSCAGDQELQQPAPLQVDPPIEYPLELWDQDIEGETLLRVKVSEAGGVDSVEVVESSGHPAFDSAAIRGARDMRFTPAQRGGKRIEVWAQVPVYFSKHPPPGRVP
jgi:TonB family protein